MTRTATGPQWLIGIALTLLAGCTADAGGSPAAPGTGTTIASTPPPISHPPAIEADRLPFPEPTGDSVPPARQAALQQALTAALHQPPPPGGSPLLGLTVAVVNPAGTWTGAAGVDGVNAPLTPQTMTAIGSVTRTVTAAEVILLAERGVLDLDAPVSTYLHHPLLDREPTIRHLLSHTSGLPEYTTDAHLREVLADPDRTWTADEALAYATVPPTEPGGDCNTNYLLLGLLIERSPAPPTPRPSAGSLAPGSGRE